MDLRVEISSRIFELGFPVGTQGKKPRGRLRQSEVFFPLAIVAHHVVPPGICPGLIQNHPDFRSCHRHFRLCVKESTLFAIVAFLVSEEYSITHYKLKDCLDL